MDQTYECISLLHGLNVHHSNLEFLSRTLSEHCSVCTLYTVQCSVNTHSILTAGQRTV